MKWLKWLLGSSEEKAAPVLESAEKKVCKCSSPKKDSVEGFVDSETGKVYKTERSRKAAQTRRRNAAKKKAKK